MPVQCRACGFDSADDSLYCEFCKEPFRKKSPQAKSAAPPPALDLPKEVLAKLPAQFIPADEEKLPTLPPWFKPFAWGFLGFWVVCGLILIIRLFLYNQQRQMEINAAPAPQTSKSWTAPIP